MRKLIIILIIFSNYLQLTSQNNKKYSIKNIDFNDQYSTFGTSFYNNNFIIFTAPKKKLFISSKRKRLRLKKRLDRMKEGRRLRVSKRIERRKSMIIRKDLEFYIGITNSTGEIIKSKQIDWKINSTKDELDLVYTNSLKTVYFTRSTNTKKKKTHLELYKADVLTAGYWVNIEKLPFNSKTYSVGHPCLNSDNSVLYFVSDMDGSLGSLDIFKVKILGSSVYGEPENLGAKVNTTKVETTPFISDNTLYFSSNGRGGLGKLDIFSINLNNGNDAINLGKPFNSSNNDLSYKTQKNSDFGYLTSNRLNGKGENDIYFFKEIIDDKIKPIITKKETIVINNNIKKQVDNNRSPKSKKNVVSISTKEINQSEIKKETKIKIPIKKTDSSLSLEEFTKCNDLLEKLNNIYFDYDKSYIREDAARELDNVIGILRKCLNIEILVTSHTDSRSSHKYNKALSQRRAEETVKYILRNGHFTPKRIKGIGFGESRLLNKCSNGVACTKIEHQVNRRTEFEISNY